MKHISNYKCLPAMCALFIVLSACSKSEPQGLDLPQNTASHSQQIQKAEEIYEPAQVETSVSTTLSSGVEVTANVEISDCVDIKQLAIYNAEIVKQDYELLKHLLLTNKEIVEETSAEIAEARTDSLFHGCVTNDGSSLAYTGEGFTYESGQHSLMQSILSSKEVDVNQFSDSEDLNFSTRENAKQDIENILKQLNLEVDKTPVCYTLSFESLQFICEKLNAVRKETFGEDSPLYTPFTCSAADACYIFIYQITAEGLPISTHPNGVFGDGSWTPGTYLHCFYSEKGLVGMKLPYNLRVTGQVSQAAQGLSASQILEKLDKKFSSMILSGDYQVNKIEFEYVSMPIKGSRNLFQLIPVWRTSVLHTCQYQDQKSNGEPYSVEEQFDIVFHAITGDELISSSGPV